MIYLLLFIYLFFFFFLIIFWMLMCRSGWRETERQKEENKKKQKKKKLSRIWCLFVCFFFFFDSFHLMQICQQRKFLITFYWKVGRSRRGTCARFWNRSRNCWRVLFLKCLLQRTRSTLPGYRVGSRSISVTLGTNSFLTGCRCRLSLTSTT